MTTPAMPRTASPATSATTDGDRLDAIAAAVAAIARHITGSDDGHEALARLGVNESQARAITG